MFDKYSRMARLYPAMLCSLPILVLNFFLIRLYAGDFLSALAEVKWIGGVTLSVACVFLLSQAGRFIGKELFEKTYFSDEMSMPTTQMLLHSDSSYSPEYKKKLHDKIFFDFNIQIYSIENELADSKGARKIIVECVSLIRSKVKSGRLLLQHNIEYGFARNLIGGSLIASYISILNLYIFGYFLVNIRAFYISLFLAFAYLLIILSAKSLIQRYGFRYAKILLQEYCST